MFILVYKYLNERHEIKANTFEEILNQTIYVWNKNGIFIEIKENDKVIKTAKETYELIGKRYY